MAIAYTEAWSVVLLFEVPVCGESIGFHVNEYAHVIRLLSEE